jgi:hypothetical protein
MVPRPLLALSMLAIAMTLLSGCGAEEPAAEADADGEIVVSVSTPPEADPNAPLPPGTCFEAVADYTLALTVHGGAPPGLCERIARFLPPEAGHAGWPMPASHHLDENTPTIECAVARETVRVEVLTWPVEQTGPRADPYDVCREMIHSGWVLQPLFPLGEELGSDADSGTCFVATERYEVALTGETKRGQPMCEQLAAEHLPAPIGRRAIPTAYPEMLGDPVCEAWRAGERVYVVSMPGDRGAIDLPSVCASLERDGWDVNRYTRN